MKLSDYLIKEIYNISGCNKIFGYIGGMIAHIVDSIYQNQNVEMVNTINEQGAGFAADGYARINNKPGIAIATSGPGATNLITPMADCFFDSVPVLFITGQVNTYEYKKYNIKQCGFQETDIVDMVKPITKYAKLITDPNDIKYELQKAIHIANSDRKGPVLLDIPMDIQRADIDETKLKEFIPQNNIKTETDFDYSLFLKTKRPLILAGNGVNLSGATDKLENLLNKTNIPVVQSLHGIDCVKSDYTYNLGFIGTYGNSAGNLALYHSDLLLVLGSRLDIRQTGAKTDFMNNKTIIQVDIDNNELECDKFNKIKINSDISEFLEDLTENIKLSDISDWQKKCTQLRNYFTNDRKTFKLPTKILSKIYDILPKDTIITADVGQNQMWAAQSAFVKQGQRIISSGGLGSMGFSLPAAIGAAVDGKPVIAITGDGGLQMNIQELEILKRRNLPIKIVVMNNKNLGMVRTFQELYFDNRTASTVYDYSAPDFAKVAEAYGIKSAKTKAENFDITEFKNDLLSDEPFLLDIEFEIHTQVEPRVQFGNTIADGIPDNTKFF